MSAGFDLIIFDCDGVLVDSERIANQVFARVLKEVCDLAFTQDQMYEHFVGNSETRCLEVIEAMLGCKPPPELSRRYRDDINQALAQSVVAVPGIELVLNQIDLPYCVASSGSHEKMQLTLGKTNLIDYFGSNIFSTSEVKRGKPHPDIYLHAAQSMGFDNAKRCLVIEDSPIGVSGAVAAGMTVFGYAELMPKNKLWDAGAHHVFDDMAKLPSLTTGESAHI